MVARFDRKMKIELIRFPARARNFTRLKYGSWHPQHINHAVSVEFVASKMLLTQVTMPGRLGAHRLSFVPGQIASYGQGNYSRNYDVVDKHWLGSVY
jgi:hypothetical protein